MSDAPEHRHWWARARATDPETSKIAAVSAPASETERMKRILVALERPMTDTELCAHLDLPADKWGTWKRTRSTLYQQGKVEWTGLQRVPFDYDNEATRGPKQRVWRTVEVIVAAPETLL